MLFKSKIKPAGIQGPFRVPAPVPEGPSALPLEAGKEKGQDWIGLGLISILVLLGVVMVYSASSRLAAERYHNSFYFAQKQLVFAGFGFMALILFRYLPYQNYQRRRWVGYILGISLLSLILVLIPGIGSKVGGASRWFRLGGISFQPAEFSKLALIIFLAYSMTKKQECLKSLSKGFLFHLGVVLVFVGLVLVEPDLGMAISILLLTGILLLVGGVRLSTWPCPFWPWPPWPIAWSGRCRTGGRGSSLIWTPGGIPSDPVFI